MLKLEVGGKGRIFIGEGLTNAAVRELKEALPSIRIFAIITDSTIAPLYLADFIQTFADQGIPLQESVQAGNAERCLLTYVVPPGERSKSREMKGQIEDFLLAQGCNRDTCLIALGGGVVGDLVGFVASTFLRGVPIVQIPTTLLAMVDSSIGGKNGVDTPSGKNLIGTIYEPYRGFTDLRFLYSLGKREFYNGMAEIVKTAAISSQEDFCQLEALAEPLAAFLDNLETLSLTDRKAKWAGADKLRAQLQEIVFASTKFKVGVVAEDARDDGLRQLLNFGHTIGHALEHYYSPRLLHGECVAMGMVLELRVAEDVGHCQVVTGERIKRLLQRLNLPISVNDPLVQVRESILPTEDQVLRAMRLDKKNSGGRIQMVLLKDIGQPVEPRALPVPEEFIVQALNLPKTTEFSDIASVPQILPTASILLIGTHVTRAQELAAKIKYRVCPFAEFANQPEPSTLYYWEEGRGETTAFLDVATNFVEKAGIVLLANCYGHFKALEELLANHSSLSFVASKDKLPDLVHLANFARGLLSNPLPDPELHSSFLCLILPSIVRLAKELEHMAYGANAVEFRVDLLSAAPPNFQFETKSALEEFKITVADQIGLLREKLSDLPIIYTVRTVAEGGRVPDNTSSDLLLELYLWGLRCGCEILDLQVNMPAQTVLRPFLKAAKGRCKIIASYHHIPEPLEWGGETCSKMLAKCVSIGDVAKLVSVAHRPGDNRALEEFTESYYEGAHRIPLIALNMGVLGKGTRVINRYLTPVTHPKITQVPGLGLNQLSLKEIRQGQALIGALEPRMFYIIGHPVSQSKSPVIHNTIFRYFGLPHTYTYLDSMDMDVVEKAIRAPGFGGGSVTMPHKLNIIPLLDSMSESARSIGAVNTVIRRKDGNLHGDNTDWLGILGCLRRAADAGSVEGSGAVVLGAGGTARAVVYALQHYGVTPIYVYNRSADRLQELINSFLDVNLIGIGSLSDIEAAAIRPFVLVDTLPSGSGVCTTELVQTLLPSGGVVVTLAYGTETGSKLELGPNTRLVTGLDILIEQGLWQSEKWTGLRLRSDSFWRSIHEAVHGRESGLDS